MDPCYVGEMLQSDPWRTSPCGGDLPAIAKSPPQLTSSCPPSSRGRGGFADLMQQNRIPG